MRRGIANIASPIVGGLPATGAIARTATNIRSGGRTPVAGMIHALVLLVILLVAAPLTASIPMAVLAAILLVLFIRRVSTTTTLSRVTKDYVEKGRAHMLQDKRIPDYVTIFRIHGPFLFGTTDKLTSLISHANELTPGVVLRLRNMTAIDATGLKAIQDFADGRPNSIATLAPRTSCRTLRQPSRVPKRCGATDRSAGNRDQKRPGYC